MQRLPGAIFQQVNAWPHTARVSQDCLRTLTTLLWPARSPDLSPNEHILNHLGRRVRHPTNLNELEARLQQIRSEMSQDIIQNLCASMPDHIVSCIRARGVSTGTVANVVPAPFDYVGDQKGMVLLPEEVGEKGFLESHSPTFRIDSSRKGHARGQVLRVPTGGRRQKRALDLEDLLIMDQLKKKAPIEFKEHHLDEWSGIISLVDLALKIEEYEDVRKTFQKKVPWSYSKDTMKKKWNNPTIIPRENVSMNNSMNTRKHKNRNNHQDFEKRRRPQCFECGSYDHFRPQCPKLKKYSSETINKLKSNSENASLDPYTIRGKVNGFEMPILRDTGASIDIICDKFTTPNMFTEVEIDCEWGHVITKADVVRKQLDQGKYILGNRTIEILESDLEYVKAIKTRSQWKKESEQKRTSEADEKEEMKLEENLAEDMENLLPSFMEEKDTKSLININTDEFIKAQQKSEELAPSIQKVEKCMNNEASDYSLTKGKLLIKSRKNKNGDLRQLLVIPEKFRSSIMKMGHEGTSGYLGVTKTKNRIARYFTGSAIKR
ncbi:retrovirus-related Pol polyprotein from transposon 412 [Trichonephila clavipes]|nr:retrovirus-related Pol polyprotein from transposon 412 [Trichonephila clavipes]